MREPWEVVASVLTVTLSVALTALVVFIGLDMAALTRADGGAAELERWRLGMRGEAAAAAAESDASNGADVAGGDGTHPVGHGGAAEQIGPLVAMVLFACIPIVTYAAGLVSFARRRRWPYVIMTGIQLVLLLAVAIPALLTLLR